MDIQALCVAGIKEWNDTSGIVSLQDRMLSEETQSQNETRIQNILDKIHCFMEDFPKQAYLQKQWKEKGMNTIERWLKEEPLPILEEMDEETCALFQNITISFLQDIRRFDPKLSVSDAMQALRNIWIIAILQKIFNKPVQYHAAMFAYSMLYPYTDNYLDDHTISLEQKQSFNSWLSKRLRGKIQNGRNAKEEQISKLVTMIERRFDRNHYQNVYESLYLIQDAQIKSLLQQDGEHKQTASQLLQISYQKGGTSVVADGFLIDGSMNHEQIMFCMRYGFMLQLGDDLQDVMTDAKYHHQTLMTHALQSNQLEPLVKQLIQYTKDILRPNTICQDKTLMDFVLHDCMFLILLAAAQEHLPFSNTWKKEIAQCLPFRHTSTFQQKFSFTDAQWWERIDILLGM